MNTDFTDIKFIDSKNYHIFSVDTYQKKSPGGKTSKFVKLNAPDWVGAIIYYIFENTSRWQIQHPNVLNFPSKKNAPFRGKF